MSDVKRQRVEQPVTTLFERSVAALRDGALMNTTAHVRMLAHDIQSSIPFNPQVGQVGVCPVYKVNNSTVAMGSVIHEGGFNSVRRGEMKEGPLDPIESVVVRTGLDNTAGRAIMYYTELVAHQQLCVLAPSTFVDLRAPLKITRHDECRLGMVLTNHNQGDLADYINNNRVDDTVMFSIIGQLMCKLQAAQTACGFMHRDLKAENVVLKTTDIASVIASDVGAFPTTGIEPLMIDLSFARYQTDGTWNSLDPYTFLKHEPKTCNPSADVTYLLYSLYEDYGKLLVRYAPLFHAMLNTVTMDFRRRVAKTKVDDDDLRSTVVHAMTLRVPHDSLTPKSVLRKSAVYWNDLDKDEQQDEMDFNKDVMKHIK